MFIKEGGGGKEYFRKLPRKELQSLCKQCGLPARKSSSEMVESLAFYFMRKGLTSVLTGTGSDAVQECLLHTSSMPPMQPEVALNSIKDSFVPRSCSREEINKGSGSFKCNGLESCMGPGASNEETCGGLINNFQEVSPFQFFSEYVGNHVNHNKPQLRLGGRAEDLPQFRRTEINTVAHSIENASPSMVTMANVPASFEFHVSSEEGIELCVDLNSIPTEWINKYKNQVSLCDNVVNPKPQSHHQELRCIGDSNKKMRSSTLLNMDSGQTRDDYLQAQPSPSAVVEENIHVRNGHPDGTSKFLNSSPIVIPCGVAADVTESLEEDPGLASTNPCSDGQDLKTLNTESCNKKECIAALDSDVTDTPLEKTACNFAVNSTSNGSVDHIALENQNAKHADEVCENSTQQNSSNLENASVVFPGCCMEMQLSEAGNYHKDALCLPHKNGKFLNLCDPKKNRAFEQDGLGNSSENDRCENHLTMCSEEQAWSNTFNARESSVCSQADGSSGKTSLKSGNTKSREEHHRKRLHVDSESQNGFGKRDTKVLRSTTHSAAKVLPRRSMSEFTRHMLPASQQLD